MGRKIIILILAFSIILPNFLMNFAFAESQVCGMDGKTYNSINEAETAGTDVSYNFACVEPSDENGLYEATSKINFSGTLIEVGSTDVPTNLIIRHKEENKDYTISVVSNTVIGQRKGLETNLSDWIPGDLIKVSGIKNENTGIIDASNLINQSINLKINKGINGWITSIDKNKKEIGYKWASSNGIFNFNSSTKFVVGLKNPAAVNDLKVGDRIRVRAEVRSNGNPLAKIIVVLRRGNDLYMKIRTFTPIATLVRMDSAIVPTTIQAKIEKTPGIKSGDVNNLIGQEGTLVTVNITENTVVVRKYFGRTTLEELSVGDSLMIVGRVNDDKTVDAKLIKNNSIWKTTTRGHAGVVKEINSANKYFTVEWTPVKYLNSKQLKEALQSKNASTTVVAQSLSLSTIANSLKERITRIKELISTQITNLTQRIIRYKKIAINRIKHDKVQIGDLIDRGEARLIKVTVDDNTKYVVGTNEKASFDDIKVGDKVRIRGVRDKTENIVYADKIVVVAALPEIDEPLSTPINDVNEIASEIVTDSSQSIASTTTTATEQEVSSDETTTCSTEAKICPDGSSVWRIAPDCEFAACPDGGVACTADAKECPDGSYVSRVAPNCEFAACPGQ